MARLYASVFTLVLLAHASPVLHTRQSITMLSAAQISAFKPFTFYAAAGYCSPELTMAWDCGTDCDAHPTFHPIASGGDGVVVQFWFVGVDLVMQSVIVSHQGTDPSKLLPLLTDATIPMRPLDPILFPGISPFILVHSGFANEQEVTARQILAAVQTGLSDFGVNSVTLVGHSLGAALSLLDSVYLPLHISGVTFQSVLYGLPRVGNQAFADFASTGNTVTHINNREDPIPTVPGIGLGFHHPTGEIHIQDSGAWDACPGQDNPSILCSRGDVPTILQSNLTDHDGPYDGVLMGC